MIEAPLIQITSEGITIPTSSKDLEEMSQRYQSKKFLRLPQFIHPSLLHYMQDLVDRSEFYTRDHNGIAKEYCMSEDNAAQSLFLLLFNEPAFFEAVEKISGCSKIGFFYGRVYRIKPGENHYDNWHDDVDGNRLLAMTLNLSRDVFQGGSLQLRKFRSPDILAEVSNTGLGDAVIFQISKELQHRVAPIEGTAIKTAFAGWFETEGGFLQFAQRKGRRSIHSKGKLILKGP